MKKEFAVIGLGNEVLAIDMKEEKARELSNDSAYVTIANETDEDTLKSLGLQNFVVVSIGDNIQPSILCTLILKEMGVLIELDIRAKFGCTILAINISPIPSDVIFEDDILVVMGHTIISNVLKEKGTRLVI